MRTHQESHVELHPKSCNNQLESLEDFKYQWMAFHLKMKSGKILLHDTSMISPLSLAFFGQDFNIGSETINGLTIDLIKVDRMIKFNCDRNTLKVIEKLRLAFSKLLAHKVACPRPSDWSVDTLEGPLLQAIVLLLTFELKVHLSTPM